MKLIIFLVTLWAFIKTISYSIYEFKNNNNKSGGITVALLGVIALILPNIFTHIRT